MTEDRDRAFRKYMQRQMDLIADAPTPRRRILAELDTPDPSESVMERRFWRAYLDLRPIELKGLVQQYQVPPYRIDFAIPDKKIGIEVDGYEHHCDKDTFTYDRRRQRDLELIGWRLIRFSGKEVHARPDQCVVEAAELAAVFQGAA